MFEKIIKLLNKENIRYLLIGRQAMMLYGAPLFSYDYDFWVHPGDKEKLFSILEDKLELEPNKDREQRRPYFVFHSDKGDKVDVFIVRKITNKEGETLEINETLNKAVEVREPKSSFFVKLPSIDDLIRLKKMGNRPKDIEDIEYLKTIKQTEESEQRKQRRKR